ncbi:MAG: patatin-like phospholipase family protein [Betaproteobacteria bacterium]
MVALVIALPSHAQTAPTSSTPPIVDLTSPVVAPASPVVAPASPVVAPASPVAAKPAGARPKIGLVLSGGGARGMTHVGVLKVLQQLNVPIDYIAATSMGAIVGGLYASGMSPLQMEKQLETVSWPTLLSDSPARGDVSFRRKEFEAEFPLGLEIGYRDGQFRTFKGALSGSNLELFLHELTRNVDRIDNFDKLPIPFRAIATDMVNGDQIIFDHGRLYQAMRASMSVPGMFAPVELDGRILGDGGLVNNLPVDVVRAMGAEIVIAVNIGTPLMSRDQLSSVVGYASQMINILTEQNVRTQLGTLRPQDVLISPNLGELTFIDFSKASEFIALGVKAAEAAHSQLIALASTPVQYAAFEQKLAVPTLSLPATLDFIRVEGTQYANPQVLEDQMKTKPGEPFNLKTLENDMARLYGRGDFEQIDYALVSQGAREGVVVNVTEKSWGPNFLRFGLLLSTDLQGDSTFNVMAGHKRVWLNSLGAQWSNEVILGSTRRYATELYQPLSLGNALYLSAYGLAQRAPEYIFDGASRVAQYDVLTQTAGLDLGSTFATSGDARIGIKWAHQRGDPEISEKVYPTIKTTEQGARALVRWDSLDNPFFARKGMRGIAEMFAGNQNVTVQDFVFDSSTAVRVGGEGIYAFEYDHKNFFNIAAKFGGTRNAENTLITDYDLGGFLQLSGLRTSQLSGAFVGFARAVYYHELMQLPVIGGAVFVGGSIEAGNVWNTRDQVSSRDLITAGSLFLAANTWVGPFYFAYGRASGGQSTFYLFLGRP